MRNCSVQRRNKVGRDQQGIGVVVGVCGEEGEGGEESFSSIVIIKPFIVLGIGVS